MLDLRNVDRYEKFNCHKFVFQVHSHPLNITTHTSSTPQEVQRADLALETVLKDGLDIMKTHHIPPYARAGANKVTLMK